MNKKFHFISGLPRSGSTLLVALLNQNPRFSADIISPLERLINANLAQMSGSGSNAGRFTEQQREDVIAGLFQSYYKSTSQDKPVIFDNNRAWTSRLPLLDTLLPNSKVICCVRDTCWILDSLERLYRKQPFENTNLFRSDSERETVYSRTTALTQPNRLVGFAWSALKEAYYGEHSDKLLLIDYETLARLPEQVMPAIYDFLEEPHFQHHFSSIEFSRDEFDQHLGVAGMHKVRSTVEFQPRRTLLPPELYERYRNQTFWDDPSGTSARVLRIRK